jgi:hypothetical protein
LRPEGDRVIDAPMVAIDLSEAMKQVKKEASWETTTEMQLLFLNQMECALC